MNSAPTGNLQNQTKMTTPKDKPIILMRREQPNKEDFDNAMIKVLDTLDGLPVTITTTSIENLRHGIHTQMSVEGELEVGKIQEDGIPCLVYKPARVMSPDDTSHAFFGIDDIQTVIVYPEKEVIKQGGIQAILYIKIQDNGDQNLTAISWQNRLTKYLN